MYRGAWQAAVHEVKKSQVQLSNRTCMHSDSAHGVCPAWDPPHFLWVVGPTEVDSPNPNRNCVTGLDGHITRFKCKSLSSGHLELIKWFSLGFLFFFFASGCCEAYIKLKKKSESVSLSVVSDSFETPWFVTCQVPLSTGFLRQEYWSRLSFPSPGIFLTHGSNPGLLHCRQILYHLSHQGGINKPTAKKNSVKLSFLSLKKEI